MVTTLAEYKEELEILKSGYSNNRNKNELDSNTADNVLEEYEDEQATKRDYENFAHGYLAQLDDGYDPDDFLGD